MQTLLVTIAIAFAVITSVVPASYATEMLDGGLSGQKQPGSIVKDSFDGSFISFGLGSLMSSGSAQQAVNQEGRREEAAKQEKARKKVAKESVPKTSGGSTNETTASGRGEPYFPTRQVPENW